MTPDILTMALEFGNGMRLADRSGIGRFGMGLPNASISQCRRVDIWTWQAGPDNAVHSYLDVVKLFEERREALLASHLINDMRLVSFAAGFSLTMAGSFQALISPR